MKLAVELRGTVIGHLEGNSERTFDFQFSPTAFDIMPSGSRALSVSIPLVAQLPRHFAERRRNWFRGLLPEGDQLDFLIAQGSLRAGDTLGFLARYGRDLAGALQIWDMNDPTEPRTPAAREVSDEEVRELLEQRVSAPLGNERNLGKSSLGGVQPKIVLARGSDGWQQVLGGAPSTHILKPWLAHQPTTIFDEEYGSRLARELGLAAFETEILEFAGLSALVIERFDRLPEGRVHQEDFSQVLGVLGSQKYQEFGGVVSLRRIATVVSQTLAPGDLTRLAQQTVFSIAIGNFDAHAKNLAVLHPEHAPPTLAPAYDQVPLMYWDNLDGRVALAINREYRYSHLTKDDLVRELQSWRVRRPAALVDETLEYVRAASARETPHTGASAGLAEGIQRTSARLLDGHAIGRG